MVDFTSSFQKGIAAAQEAGRNRSEVNAVFNEMNSQLAVATNGIIEIVRRRFEEPKNILSTGTLASLFEKKTYWALCVLNKVHPEFGTREIARWTQDPVGYPCWINTSDSQLACEDRKALEQGLAGLISTPAAGEIIYQALHFTPKQKQP